MGGVKIGEGTQIFEPKNILVDTSRPELIEIGKHVFLHGGTTILTHDWASWCFVESDHEFYPSHAKVKIGDNVWLGRNVTICKGVTIGNNCIIGIGSVVTKDIPANSIAVGVPAKVVGSYEDYMKRRSSKYVDEAIEYAEAIIESGREPQIDDFHDDYPCFVDVKIIAITIIHTMLFFLLHNLKNGKSCIIKYLMVLMILFHL